MSGSGSLVARLRQPAYTGENRCLPCTIVNVTIAAVGTTFLTAGLTAAGYPTVALWGGTVALAGALAAVWLRGYLVPGTPGLTKRYLPEPVLATFGKAPAGSPDGLEGTGGETTGEGVIEVDADADGSDALDVEALLERAGAIEPCRGDDRCLTDAVGEAWRDEIDRVEAADDPTPWLEALDIDGGEVTTTDLGASFVVSVDGARVGAWESRPAFAADLAAGAVLADRVEEWSSLPARARGQVCSGLRIFLETCPGCGGPVSFATETVESCCSSRTVAAVSCDDCGARVFESPVDEDRMAA
ncbi:MAG: hypothetical protein ABEJ26_02475 [Halosimplex sp.]